MRTIAEAAGVTRIEGEVTRVETDSETGFVRSLLLKSGEVVEGDLFIDCSGFRSLLLGQTLGMPWLDWSHWLPMDRAWAVPCEHGGARKPYTMSTAAEAGWLWQIPLQHRVGNGHVFSSQWMDDERACDLLLSAIPGAMLAEPRLIRFRTGRYEKSWVKNVVGIGLSSGFIEPLESTSIYFIQTAIQKLLTHLPDRTFSSVNTEVFNQRLSEDYAVVRDVIIMHYHLTERNDSGLWNHVRTMDVPDSLRQRLDIFRERGMLINKPEETFMSSSWLAIMLGQGPFPRSHSPLLDGPALSGLRDMLNGMREQIAAWVEPLPTQDELLRHHGLI
jgi:tryptophan halogenase